LNRARRSGRIDWSAIRDDGWTIHTPHYRSGPEELVRAFRSEMETLRLDRQDGQPVRLWIAVEAAGMLPQIERIAEPFGITCCSSGGFDSTTAKHGLAELLSEQDSCEVLHIGDHDPSGVHLFENLEADISAFADDEGFGADITFIRLAVTPEQITALALPTAPPKATDRRVFHGDTVQAEAIPPNVLAQIVQEAIDARLDQKAYRAVLERERAIHRWTERKLVPLLRSIPDFEADWT
jgi:hypothetical protein